MSELYDVIVVGGGAAGIIAAGRAAELGARVLLLEKSQRLGMKILISGGGKCNLTHDGSMEELRSKFRAEEARFLKPSFYKYTNQQFLTMIHERGLATYTRPDGRVFPVEPADAKTVVRLLVDSLYDRRVHIRCDSAVTGIAVENGEVQGVFCGEDFSQCSSVVLSVGGSSYPATGTTGDGWRWLRAMGHTITPLRAALAPISLVQSRPEWSGVALRDIVLKVRDGKQGKEIARFAGDLLYTHKGISGPTTLGVSREVSEALAGALGSRTPYLEADLAPTSPFESLRDIFRADALASPRRTLAHVGAVYLPARLLPTLFELSETAPDLRLSQISAKQITKLINALKEWPLGEPSGVPLERGEVVAGGVALSEVDPQTMGSRVISGLFLCGELLDLAGPVGGYNLQAAWSTGFVAGTNSAGLRLASCATGNNHNV